MFSSINLFNKKTFLVLILPIIVIFLIDTSLIKIYDIVDKYFIQTELKILIFSMNSFLCLFLQYFILRNLKIFSLKTTKEINIIPFFIISLFGICLSALLISLIIFQMYFYHYYDKNLIQLIQILNYGVASFFIIKLSTLFISWFKQRKKIIFLLYFVTIAIIAFNLIVTSYYVALKINDRPVEIREFVGGSVDISHGKYAVLKQIYLISYLASFIFMWITTGILLSNYRDKPIQTIAFWIILSLPVIYFLMTYFGQPIFSFIIFPYLTEDPISVSIILTVLQTLSKPIGGLTFGILFWRISKSIRYEKNIKIFMAIAGVGVMLMFGTNQATTLVVAPYPPFGISTITILNISSFLMLIGIYYSAILSSVNINLRNSVQKIALESKLLDMIGHAEREKELNNTVKRILQSHDTTIEDYNVKLEIDKEELKKYVDSIIRESRDRKRKKD